MVVVVVFVCLLFFRRPCLQPRPAEVMVDGSDWTFIRRPDTLKDMLAPYKTDSE